MRNLLSANFVRLWKSRLFWVLESVIALCGMVVYVLAAVNTRSFGAAWALSRANGNFFFVLLYIGPALAIFCGFFLGTEYTDGTMRNKLCAGHTRRTVYLANLAVCAAAGLLFLMTHMLCACTAGLTFVGRESLYLRQPLLRILCAVSITTVYAAFFTLIAMLDANKAQALVTALLLAMAVIFAGVMVFAFMQEPPFVDEPVMSEAGVYELRTGIPNSRYLTGPLRTFFQVLDTLLPSSQMMRLVGTQEAIPVRLPLCSMGLAAALTAIGLFLFKRKDLR